MPCPAVNSTMGVPSVSTNPARGGGVRRVALSEPLYRVVFRFIAIVQTRAAIRIRPMTPPTTPAAACMKVVLSLDTVELELDEEDGEGEDVGLEEVPEVDN
jgi:hypothetical protein